MTQESDPEFVSTVVLLTRDLMLGSSISAGGASGVRLCQAGAVEQCLQLVRDDGAVAVIVDLSIGSDSLTALAAGLPNEVLSRSIAFGPHVHEARLQQAREIGFGTVISRGQFVSQHRMLLKSVADDGQGG